jgi:DNA-binding MarR family transcriptional regulator
LLEGGRDYKGKIEFYKVPKTIIKDKNMSLRDSLVLGVIYSITTNNDMFYGTNSYLAKVLNCTRRTISTSISNLKDNNYINIKYNSSFRRQITINENMLMDSSTTYDAFV